MQTQVQGVTNAVALLADQQSTLVSKLDNFTEVVTNVVRDTQGGRGSRRQAIPDGADADDESDEPRPLPMRNRKKKFKLTGQRKQRTPDENALHVSSRVFPRLDE